MPQIDYDFLMTIGMDLLLIGFYLAMNGLLIMFCVWLLEDI